MVSGTTVDVVGRRTVSLKTTGHEKCRVTVGLAAKGDGTKLKPIIVFKGAKREVEKMSWDTYGFHLMPPVQKSLKNKKIDIVFVPGGCTKYIQAPDVSWNKPFKAYCTERYDEWLETIGIHKETDGGN